MKNNCFHCGLEVPENVRFPVRFENEEHETCCAGCQAVAQSIIDAGLGSYYKQRTAEAEKAVLPPGLNRAMRRHSWKCHEASRTDDREQAGSLDRSSSAGVTAGRLWR